MAWERCSAQVGGPQGPSAAPGPGVWAAVWGGVPGCLPTRAPSALAHASQERQDGSASVGSLASPRTSSLHALPDPDRRPTGEVPRPALAALPLLGSPSWLSRQCWK